MHMLQPCRVCAKPSQNASLTDVCLAASDGFDECNIYFYDPEVFGDFIKCGVDRATGIIVDCIVALALLYFLITYVLLFAKLRGYRKQPYTSVQVGLVYNTLQARHAPPSQFVNDVLCVMLVVSWQ